MHPVVRDLLIFLILFFLVSVPAAVGPLVIATRAPVMDFGLVSLEVGVIDIGSVLVGCDDGWLGGPVACRLLWSVGCWFVIQFIPTKRGTDKSVSVLVCTYVALY